MAFTYYNHYEILKALERQEQILNELARICAQISEALKRDTTADQRANSPSAKRP